MNTLYGLPETVKFCKRCVLSNQRPNSTVEFKHSSTRGGAKYTGFDAEGICDACLVADQKNQINWKIRQESLLRLLDEFRGKTKPYDCVIPGSGGKDSFFTAHVLKEKFGMSPLLATWQPIRYTQYGLNQYFNWVDAIGADSVSFKANPDLMKLLTRLSFFNLLHPFQTFILGQKNYAPKIALRYGIQLIFYGESPAEYGNGLTEFKNQEMNPEYYSLDSYKDVKLAGIELKELESDFGIDRDALEAFLPLERKNLKNTNLRYLYLSHFLKWDPQENFYYAAKRLGFRPRPYSSEGTYTRYASFDDKIDDLHYFTTHIKFGIGRATYDASQEVRNGHITREDAVNLVKQFDGNTPSRYLNEITDYLEISLEEFFATCDKFRSPHLWEITKDGRPKLKHAVWHQE